MAIRPWKAHDGRTIRVGDRRARVSLRLIDQRIKNADKDKEDFIRCHEWDKAGKMDLIATGLQTAFNIIYEEFQQKR